MEFLRAIGPVFNFLLLALALVFFTRKQIRKLFQERRDRIADALGRAADAQDQARHTAEDIAEAQQAADAEARAQLAEAKAQAEANTAAADAETAREAEAVRRGVEQTEAQLRSDMEDRVSDAAIGRITAATAGVLTQDAFAPARAALVDDFVANIGAHLTTQPSDALTLAETGHADRGGRGGRAAARRRARRAQRHAHARLRSRHVHDNGTPGADRRRLSAHRRHAL